MIAIVTIVLVLTRANHEPALVARASGVRIGERPYNHQDNEHQGSRKQ
jgi:hypothetical protein